MRSSREVRREAWSARRSSLPEPQVPSSFEEIRRPWSRSERLVPRRLVRPLQAFLRTEEAGGVLLVAAAIVALLWANGPWRTTYATVWATRVTVGLGRWSIRESLGGWIGEGLMSLFFLVAALEIKRELATGELRDRRSAVLPVIAAIGGMVVPALIYLAVDPRAPASRGWGVVTPTDIAFAVGVVTLVGARVPRRLLIFLLTLAIADDLASIVVVALFYSRSLDSPSVAAAAAFGGVILLLQRIHVRAATAYLLPAAGMWLALHGSGLSPTLAGVAVGFLTPATAFQRPAAVSREAHRVADQTVDEPDPPDADAAQWLYLAALSKEAVSPLARLESLLHPVVSFLVLPLFALSAAGVTLSSHGVSTRTGKEVAVGIITARLLGKPIGITLAALGAVKVGMARLPEGVQLRHVVGVGMAAGIPFTVSLFIAELALPSHLLDAAKIGVLVSAVLAGVLGFLILRAGSE
jgi:Na+:H+ antiporter, NhaA family